MQQHAPADRRSPRHRPAQSLVEFALILPVLTALLFGIAELGVLLHAYTNLTNTAREAARTGAIYQETSPVVTAPEIAAMDGRRRAALSSVITDTLSPAIDRTPAALQVTVVYTPSLALASNPYRASDLIGVQLTYNHTLFFGLLGPRQMQLRASSAMRIEPGGTP